MDERYAVGVGVGGLSALLIFRRWVVVWPRIYWETWLLGMILWLMLKLVGDEKDSFLGN